MLTDSRSSLSEIELSEKLGVSRTPVREAYYKVIR